MRFVPDFVPEGRHKRPWMVRTRRSRRKNSSIARELGCRNQRLAKDFENLAETLATFVSLASIQPALRRLARAEPAPRNPP